MPLAIGTRLGAYEIIALIGAGGMGEVYRARDTRLNRDAAIKVLPETFARDAERLARFKREAHVLASLNHPHIGAIYGLEETATASALILELVEGEDLSERIARGPVPLEEALPIAKQIAEALEAAHEHGVIHRDLKPANIKLKSDGTVKVLDFGLAKSVEGSSVRADLSASPTITSPAVTMGGVILGTAAYMSPEQARGKPVDKRADIWAFGCVLFEMLTGKRAFDGDEVSDVLASVLAKEPDWTWLPAALSPVLANYVRRCLQKDARQRIHDIADVRLALEGAFDSTVPQRPAPVPSFSRARLTWVLVGGTVVAAALLAIPAVWHLRETLPPETRSDIITPVTGDPTDFALSPDGRQIVFVSSSDGPSRLWLRSLATTTARPLAGTDGAAFPFWAPDSRSIGFAALGALMRLDLGGGAPRRLAQVTNFRGGTWNTDGVIVFGASASTPLMRVSATGSAATAVTALGPQQAVHRFPDFLPGGQRFLFHVQGGPDAEGIYLGALDGSAPKRLVRAESNGVYLPAGWLVWAQDGTLVAQRLDLARATLTGEPVTLADGVSVGIFTRSPVSVAAAGLVAYRAGWGSQRQLTWVDRSGTVQGTLGDPDATLIDARVSPDGHRVVVSRTVKGNTDLWLMDGSRTPRLTVDAASDRSGVWSPDGARSAFHSLRSGGGDIYQKLTSGAGVEERLVTSNQRKTPLSWSADGHFLLYQAADQVDNLDLWILPMQGDRTPWVFLKTPFREGYGTFSPDGRWVAYMSNESGTMEIYIRPFIVPGTAESVAEAAGKLVSTAGGTYPVWRPDGQELYYLSPAGTMMAVPIVVSRSNLVPGAPVELFPTRIFGGGVDTAQRRQYDLAPDGRFLINTVPDSATAPITLLMNWNPEEKR
jgi:serine/threonine protein kinase